MDIMDERSRATQDLFLSLELGILNTLGIPKNKAKPCWRKQSDEELLKGMTQEDGEVIDALLALGDQGIAGGNEKQLDHLQRELRDKLATTAFFYERVIKTMKDNGYRPS